MQSRWIRCGTGPRTSASDSLHVTPNSQQSASRVHVGTVPVDGAGGTQHVSFWHRSVAVQHNGFAIHCPVAEAACGTLTRDVGCVLPLEGVAVAVLSELAESETEYGCRSYRSGINPSGGSTGTDTNCELRSRTSNVFSTLHDPRVAAQVAHTVLGVEESSANVRVMPAATSAAVGVDAL